MIRKNISKVLKLLFSVSIIYILIQYNIININDIALLTKNYTLVLYSLIIFFYYNNTGIFKMVVIANICKL